jgi:hypothetical protein
VDGRLTTVTDVEMTDDRIAMTTVAMTVDRTVMMTDEILTAVMIVTVSIALTVALEA